MLMLVIDILCDFVICCGDVRPGSTKSPGPPLLGDTLRGERPGDGCGTRGDGERGEPGTSFAIAGENSTAAADASSSDPHFLLRRGQDTSQERVRARATSPPRTREL
jgi:hypothetical protein